MKLTPIERKALPALLREVDDDLGVGDAVERILAADPKIVVVSEGPWSNTRGIVGRPLWPTRSNSIGWQVFQAVKDALPGLTLADYLATVARVELQPTNERWDTEAAPGDIRELLKVWGGAGIPVVLVGINLINAAKGQIGTLDGDPFIGGVLRGMIWEGRRVFKDALRAFSSPSYAIQSPGMVCAACDRPNTAHPRHPGNDAFRILCDRGFHWPARTVLLWG